MSALARELRTLTYTPALCAHLDDLRRSCAAQVDIGRNRLEKCEQVNDEGGIKISTEAAK